MSRVYMASSLDDNHKVEDEFDCVDPLSMGSSIGDTTSNQFLITYIPSIKIIAINYV